MKKLIWMALLSMIACGAYAAVDVNEAERVPASGRKIIPLDGEWRFVKSDAETAGAVACAWESVTIPHSWNALDGQNGKALGGA
jgi:hypothetical protein